MTGGDLNLASDPFAAASGGCQNVAGAGSATKGTCPTKGAEAVLGGFADNAPGLEATVSGGEQNSAQATASSILGGDGNTATAKCQAIPAAPGSC